MRNKSHRSTLFAVCAAGVLMSGDCVAGGLTAASAFPPGSDVDRWVNEFASCVGEQLGFPVEVYSGGKLGGPEEVMGAIQKGSIDFAVLPVATLTQSWKALNLLTVPGAVNSPKDIQRLSQDPQFTEMLDKMGAESSGFHFVGLGWQYQTFAGQTGTLVAPAGKGVQAADFGAQQVFSKLGAFPQEVPAGEVIGALGAGLIDGAVLSVEEATQFGKGGSIPAVTWSEGYTPFTIPVAIVMSDQTSRSWGAGFLGDVRTKCAGPTERFNSDAIVNAMANISTLQSIGTSVQPYDESTWHRVTDQVYQDAVVQFGAEALASELNRIKQQ